MKTIILLRHAQSIKNIKHIHGGQGEALTEEGVKQAKQVSLLLKENYQLEELHILASTSMHTQATAKIIAEELGIQFEKPFLFKPLYLGLADGLSEQELEKDYPQINQMFLLWRSRAIDIKKLTVPLMENYMSFWNRGNELLSTLPDSGTIVLVCSNSLMILLAHILLNNNPETTDNYRHICIQNCGMIVFDSKTSVLYEINNRLTTVDLYCK